MSSSSSQPPELRTVCRRLTTTRPEQLPALLPTLIKDVLRCQGPLSRPAETKGSDSSREATDLVNKLKTQISSLVSSRSPQARFAGAALVKAAIEAGGWECLGTSDTWVRGLLSIIQKKDPTPVKDLCIVTLTKIFVQMHKYQTLVREIVTPNLSTFATACLQILKPPASSKISKAPLSLVETVFEAISTLLPLYPTTLRQSAPKFRNEARQYAAPTSSDDGLIVPESLHKSSQKLIVRLNMTGAKGADSTEWTQHVDELIKDAHATADQVFRAVKEHWESTSSYVPQTVNLDAEPQGGGKAPGQLPAWTGLQAGSERLVGIFEFITEHLRNGTRSGVTIPVSAIIDLLSRISSIVAPSSSKDKYGSMQLNPAVGREEREEMWSLLPSIQVAALHLHDALIARFGRSYVSASLESLEQTVRIFESGYRIPEVRTSAFALARELIILCGPSLHKETVASLGLMIKSCCRDLLGAAGHLKQPKQQTSAGQNGTKSRSVTHNADAFLSNKSQDESLTVSLSPEHVSAAESFLATLFSHLPQQHLGSSLRARMLQAAILGRNRDAQVASVLHPFRDSSGRMPQVILPYLMRQFPHDESVEMLRFNFRPSATGSNGDFMEVDDDVMDEDDAQARSKKAGTFSFGQPIQDLAMDEQNEVEETEQPDIVKIAPPVAPTLPEKASVFVETSTSISVDKDARIPDGSANSLKRKNENSTPPAAKRVETQTTSMPVRPSGQSTATSSTSTAAVGGGQADNDDDDDDSDDGSIQLNMELDSDSEDGEE